MSNNVKIGKIEHFDNLVKGAIFGHIVSDIFATMRQTGVDINSKLVSPSYSSSSAMMLCVMASLNEVESFDPDDIMAKLYDFYIGGYMAKADETVKVGQLNRHAINNHSNGMPTDRCALSTEAPSTDGEALIRTLPIALYYSNDSIDSLINNAHQLSTMTHNHVYDQVYCALYAVIIRNLLLEKTEKAFEVLGDYYKTKKMTAYCDALQQIKINRSGIFWAAWNIYSGSDGYFVDTINSHNCVCHHTACLAGGLSGSSDGVENIPSEWLDKLNLPSEVSDTILQFIGKVVDKYDN